MKKKNLIHIRNPGLTPKTANVNEKNMPYIDTY